MKAILSILCILAATVLTVHAAGAAIYKYQKDGVWYYTDTPPEDMPKDNQQLVDSTPQAPVRESAGTPLLSDYPAKNDLERAVAATVAVRSPMGYGSGFFITSDGYIVTNKHVIRATAGQSRRNAAYFEEVQKRIDQARDSIAQEEEQLKQNESYLKRLRERIESESDPLRKQQMTEDYENKTARLNAWKKDFQKRRKIVEQNRQRFLNDRSSYEYTKTVAGLARSFTVILADNSEYYARLVATSRTHDLALLKLDGYRVPALSPADATVIAQGHPVYAIGNPVKLRNSVTSGVFSGFEKGFIQTNAQIYPGNSGGPLVTGEGAVLGINTFKKLTHKFEGLGFAIPVSLVFSEFSQYLPGR